MPATFSHMPESAYSGMCRTWYDGNPPISHPSGIEAVRFQRPFRAGRALVLPSRLATIEAAGNRAPQLSAVETEALGRKSTREL